MHRRNRFLSAFVLLGVLLPGISFAAVLPAEEMAEGKKLTVLKCAKCHKLYDPGDYKEDEWKEWMAKMKKKAHLSDEQYRLISGYLDSLRKS